MKYGLKILFPDNEYLWMTTGHNMSQLEPVLFDSKELTLDFVSKIWGSTADNLMFGEKIRVEPHE
jgi:hypothetical protein